MINCNFVNDIFDVEHRLSVKLNVIHKGLGRLYFNLSATVTPTKARQIVQITSRQRPCFIASVSGWFQLYWYILIICTINIFLCVWKNVQMSQTQKQASFTPLTLHNGHPFIPFIKLSLFLSSRWPLWRGATVFYSCLKNSFQCSV